MDNQRQIELAQLAAYIDGEGSIYTIDQRSQLCISVANADPRLPNWCMKITGAGSVYRNRHRSESHKRDSFSWRVYGKAAEVILRECLPYFIIKREQAELGIAYRETYRQGRCRFLPIPEDVKTKRAETVAELKRLKHELPEAIVN
jgi:hypothetical protein